MIPPDMGEFLERNKFCAYIQQNHGNPQRAKISCNCLVWRTVASKRLYPYLISTTAPLNDWTLSMPTNERKI